MRDVRVTAGRLLTLMLLLALSAGSLWGSTGRVVGVVRDADGNPLADLLVSIVERGVREALPVLTRTNAAGQLSFQNIEPGLYELSVTSSRYVNPAGRLIAVEPGETVSIQLVLEQLLALGGDSENLGIKSLLRSATNRRLIFRSTPGVSEDNNPFFGKAALQVVTDTGLGADSFSFPGSDLTGTTTSFAVQDSLMGAGDYLVAGQIHSGTDSSWRIRNILDYELASNHSLRLFLGYGRVSFGQPDYAAATDLIGSGEVIEPATATKILSAGVEDRLNLGDSLSILLGFELNQVRNRETRSFLSPNAQIDYTPFEGTALQVRVASRRKTRASSVQLPDGELVSLSDAVFLSPLGENLTFGTTRQVEARVVQSLGERTSFEVAAFRSRIQGAPVPILASWEDGSGSEVLPLQDNLAGSQGYRLAVSREITPNVKATVSYVRATAAGLAPTHPAAFAEQPDFLGGQVERRLFHGLATEVEAFIPASQTHITALLKAAPGGSPLVSLDALSDFADTSDHGLNLYVRQLLPVPEALLGFMGLDFLAAYRLEILLDVRNLTNEELGLLESSLGNLVLVQRPRTVRGGIAVKF